SGDEPVRATLRDGPVQDFNVMTRRTAYRHALHFVVGPEGSARRRMDATCGLLLCVQGTFRAPHGTVVNAGQAYVWDEGENGRVDAVGGSSGGIWVACTRVK